MSQLRHAVWVFCHRILYAIVSLFHTVLESMHCDQEAYNLPPQPEMCNTPKQRAMPNIPSQPGMSNLPPQQPHIHVPPAQVPPATSTSASTAVSKFYVVIRGRQPGIYRSWAECHRQVNGFPGCSFKSFKCAEEADAYWRRHRF